MKDKEVVSRIERYTVGIVFFALGLYILWSMSYDSYGVLSGLFFSSVGFLTLLRRG